MQIILQSSESINKHALSWTELHTISFSWTQQWIWYIGTRCVYPAKTIQQFSIQNIIKETVSPSISNQFVFLMYIGCSQLTIIFNMQNCISSTNNIQSIIDGYGTGAQWCYVRYSTASWIFNIVGNAHCTQCFACNNINCCYATHPKIITSFKYVKLIQTRCYCVTGCAESNTRTGITYRWN